MRLLTKLVFSVVFAIVIVFSTMAEEVSFEAALDANKVAMGAAVQLTLTVRGTQDVNAPAMPSIDGIETKYLGPSTQIKVINGEYSSAKAFTYMLIPLKAGHYVLPSFSVDVKGRSFQTNALSLDVLAADSDPKSGGSADEKAVTGRQKLEVVLPVANSYVNEEIPLTVRLFVNETPIQDITFPQINQDGFLLSEFSRPKQYQQMVDGRLFDVVEFNTRLTPTRPGQIRVGPVVVTGNMLVKNSVRRNPFGGSMDDDFFVGFFNSYQKKPIAITADPVALNVKDLPREGRPDDFSGGVGKFKFDVTPSPLKVRVGDPVTVKMLITGTGDLKTVKMPLVQSAQFKAYDPQIKEFDDQKLCEQVLVPLEENVKEIPAVSFSYFDTAEGRYVTVRRGPFPLEVSPVEKGQEFQAVGFTDKPAALIKDSLGHDIVYIKDHAGRITPRQDWMGRNGLLLAVLLIYINVWGGLVGVYFYRRKLARDPGFARRSRALRAARQEMKELKSVLTEGAAKDCYARLLRIWHDYLEKKIGLPLGRTDWVSVEKELISLGVSDQALMNLKEVYQLAEQACYASSAVNVEDRRRSFFDVDDAMDEVERRVK